MFGLKIMYLVSFSWQLEKFRYFAEKVCNVIKTWDAFVYVLLEQKSGKSGKKNKKKKKGIHISCFMYIIVLLFHNLPFQEN